jgi:hypothetical protein
MINPSVCIMVRRARWLSVSILLLLFGVMPLTVKADAPVLLSFPNSSRAVALDSLNMRREPFPLTAPLQFTGATDQRTRIMLFALNLKGATATQVKVDGEDQAQRHYDLKVEYVGTVPGAGMEQLTEVVVKLSDTLANVGDLFVKLTYQGATSNRVRVGVGYLGDGASVLDFDGAPKSIDYGGFWPANVDLGQFYWEFWAMPGADNQARYLVSDGYGGAHALLFGTGYIVDGYYPPAGNIWNGTGSIDFSSDTGPAPFEWAHLAVGWDGEKIVTYYDGVPVGKTEFKGPRRCAGGESGASFLLIGGSTHQNWIGRIAQVRAYEGKNPRADVNGNGQSLAAFAPQTIFEPDGSTLLSSFMNPTPSVSDLSGNKHTGTLRSTACGYQFDCSGMPLPQFVSDPKAPNVNPFSTAPEPFNTTAPKLAPGTLIFDSFTRRNSTYMFDAPGGLATTENSPGGGRVWQYLGSDGKLLPFGILNGQAVALANRQSAAWVSTGDEPANLDIRVDRRPGTWGSGISTGLIFRLMDESNFFVAYTSGTTATDQKLYISFYMGGILTKLVDGIQLPQNWTTLQVVTLESGVFTVYIDSIALYSNNTPYNSTGRGAGLWNNSPGLGLANRWDNFTVLRAEK